MADKRPPAYVGIDLHKKTLQVEVQDPDGNVVSNRKVQNTSPAIRREFAAMPQDTLCVMESSSVWYERFRFIRDDLVYDTVLSNPAQTKAIAASKKKPTRSTRTSWPTCSGEDTSQNRTCRARRSSRQGSWSGTFLRSVFSFLKLVFSFLKLVFSFLSLTISS